MGQRFEELKPALAMIGLQFSYAGVALLTRAALLKGMSPQVFVFYRQAVATLVMAPVAFASSGTQRLTILCAYVAGGLMNCFTTNSLFSDAANPG